MNGLDLEIHLLKMWFTILKGNEIKRLNQKDNVK